MARKAKKRLFCLDPRKGQAGHRVCLPYSDYDRESRDFTLRAIKKAAVATGGGTISSCDRAQRRCHVIARPWGSKQRTVAALGALVVGTAWWVGNRPKGVLS